MGAQRNFHHQTAAVEVPIPRIGGRPMPTGDDVYYRVEVFTQTGSEGDDLVGLTQVINDVLDRYVAHLGFLSATSERDYASVITPIVIEAEPALPAVADDVERIDDDGDRPAP